MARTTTRRGVLLATLALAVVSCGSGGVPLEEDAGLSAKIEQLQETGGSARLKDLTGGDWNSVYIFPEEVSREYVEQKVGARIDMGEFWWGKSHILVFMKDGKAQRAVWTSSNNLVEGRFSGGVVLQAVPGAPKLEVFEGP